MWYMLCSSSGATKRVRITSDLQAYTLLTRMKKGKPQNDYYLQIIH